MGKITISQPDGPYNAVIDTGAMDVEHKETFLGVAFITENGERLSVCMRDTGFELKYSGYSHEADFYNHVIELKEGVINCKGKS